jgi:hypothetical protein
MQTGEVFGTLKLVHAAPAKPTGIVGVVTFTNATGQETKVHTSNAGTYSTRLNVGQYTVTGSTPSFDDGKSTCVYSLHGQLSVDKGSRSEVPVLCDPANLK